MMYIAFLRGINVSGKNKIGMDDLKSMFESLGSTDIKTYLNTGNVIFKSVQPIAETTVEEAIKRSFDLDISVIVKELKEVQHIVASYDLDEGLKNCYITLFKEPINNIEDMILKVKLEGDLYQIFNNRIHLFIPGGYGKSKLTNNYLEKKTARIATTRNLKTMTKLSEML